VSEAPVPGRNLSGAGPAKEVGEAGFGRQRIGGQAGHVLAVRQGGQDDVAPHCRVKVGDQPGLGASGSQRRLE
jgi:hypothetical protein